LAASFVNPYGYKLHLHIYRYLSDRFLMDNVSEFRSPDFHSVAQQCFAVLLLATIAALASARRKPAPSRLLVIILAAYSGLFAARNLPVSSMLLTLTIAPLLSESIAKAGENAAIAPWLRGLFTRLHDFGMRMEKLELRFQGHFWLVLVFILGLWACMHGGRLGSTQWINAYFDDKRFPVEAAEGIAVLLSGPVGRVSDLPALSANQGVGGRSPRFIWRPILQGLLEGSSRPAGLGKSPRRKACELDSDAEEFVAWDDPRANAAVEANP
jgi:hypothetical protein